MKNNSKFSVYSLIIICMCFILANRCKKDDNIGNNHINFNSSIIYGSLTDQEGNKYKTVTIGIQTRMAENLKTTKYNDCTVIPIVADNIEWGNTSSPAYCWLYNNNATYKATYGAFYNWYTVNMTRLCPKGWHMPSDAEWTTLINFPDFCLSGSLQETTGLKESSPVRHVNKMSRIFAPGCALILCKPELVEKLHSILYENFGTINKLLTCSRRELHLVALTEVMNICPMLIINESLETLTN